MRDLHNNIKASRGISPAAANTGDTAFTSQIIDRQGFGSVEFIGQLGAIADANVTFAVLVEDGDDAALGDNAAVANENLLGVEAGTIASGVSAGDGANPGYGDDNKTFKIGYIGPKRYVRVTITPNGNSGDIYLAGIWLLGNPEIKPQSTQVV